MTTVSPIPAIPVRGSAGFGAAFEALLVALRNVFVGEVNAVAGEINTAASTASGAATTATTAASTASAAATVSAAAANFKGSWSALTGALAVPASVAHSGRLWVLLSNIADVTAKTPGVAAEWQNLSSLSVDIKAPVQAVAALAIDCSLSTYFTKTVAADSTFSLTGVPTDRAYGLTLKITHTSGVITFPASVKWAKNTPPTFTAGKTHLVSLITDNGGTRWRGAALANFPD